MEPMGTFTSYCHKLNLYACAPSSVIYWLDNGPVAPAMDGRDLIDGVELT